MIDDVTWILCCFKLKGTWSWRGTPGLSERCYIQTLLLFPDKHTWLSTVPSLRTSTEPNSQPMAELQTKAEPASVPAPAAVEPQPPPAETPSLDAADKKAVVAAAPAPAAETKALAVVEKESESEFLFFRWSKFHTFACSESWVVVKIQLLQLHDEKEMESWRNVNSFFNRMTWSVRWFNQCCCLSFSFWLYAYSFSFSSISFWNWFALLAQFLFIHAQVSLPYCFVLRFGADLPWEWLSVVMKSEAFCDWLCLVLVSTTTVQLNVVFVIVLDFFLVYEKTLVNGKWKEIELKRYGSWFVLILICVMFLWCCDLVFSLIKYLLYGINLVFSFHCFLWENLSVCIGKIQEKVFILYVNYKNNFPHLFDYSVHGSPYQLSSRVAFQWLYDMSMLLLFFHVSSFSGNLTFLFAFKVGSTHFLCLV